MDPVPGLEELYRRYKTELYRYLCHLTRDPTEAEDLLSETFLRALRGLGSFKGEGSVRTWLYSIARNVWLEACRKRHPAVSYDDLLEQYLATPAAQEAPARLALARVRELLASRGGRDRAVVELRAQGYSYAELAQRLHIAENTARVIEHRTRTWLKAMLQKEEYTDV